MKNQAPILLTVTALIAAALTGCAAKAGQVVNAKESIQASLAIAKLSDVTVSQDRVKGIVTLGGSVKVDSDKLQAESIAKSFSGSQHIANEIAVISVAVEAAARKQFAIDLGIMNNLEAALRRAKLRDGVRSSVRNQVVTLSGELSSDEDRAQIEMLAAALPKVRQVVNHLQLRTQIAASFR